MAPLQMTELFSVGQKLFSSPTYNFIVIEKKYSIRDGCVLEGDAHYQMVFKKFSCDCDL